MEQFFGGRIIELNRNWLYIKKVDWHLAGNEKMTMTERDTKPPHLKATSKKASAVVNKAVSSKRKAYYDDIAGQQVPDRFIELLDKLDEQSK